MSRSSRRKKTIIYILAGAVFVILCVVFGLQTINVNRKNEELEKRKVRLEQMLVEQQQRSAQLEDEELYTRTKKFIEEKAKSIGYVYPDEIIFKKSK